MFGKGNFTLLDAWFKQFVSSVFIQSFQAVFLMFSMMLLSNVQKATDTTVSGKAEMILAIIAIASSMALIKFEKMFKKWFGISESPVGDTAAAGAKMFMGAKSGLDLGQKAVGKFQNIRKANKDLGKTTERRQKLEKAYNDEYGSGGGSNSTSTSNPNSKLSEDAKSHYKGMIDAKKGAQEAENMKKNYHEDSQNYKEYDALQKSYENDYKNLREKAANSMRADNTATQGGGQGNNSSGNLENDNSTAGIMYRERKERKEKELEDIREQEREQQKAARSAGFKAWAGAAGTLASLSVGFGAADETSESLAIANVINTPLSAGVEKYSDARAGRQLYSESKDQNGKGDIRYLSKSIGESIKEVMKDYSGSMNKSSAMKISIDQVNSIKFNGEKKKIKRTIDSVDGV